MGFRCPCCGKDFGYDKEKLRVHLKECSPFNLGETVTKQITPQKDVDNNHQTPKKRRKKAPTTKTKGRFGVIKDYLSRIRADEVNVLEDTEYTFWFTLSNKVYGEKSFMVSYHCEENPYRSIGGLPPPDAPYQLFFIQDYVWICKTFGTVSDVFWFENEDFVVHEIKRLKKNWRGPCITRELKEATA